MLAALKGETVWLEGNLSGPGAELLPSERKLGFLSCPAGHAPTAEPAPVLMLAAVAAVPVSDTLTSRLLSLGDNLSMPGLVSMDFSLFLLCCTACSSEESKSGDGAAAFLSAGQPKACSVSSPAGFDCLLLLRQPDAWSSRGDACLLLANRLGGCAFCLPAAKLAKMWWGSSGCEPQPDRWREALPAGDVEVLKRPARQCSAHLRRQARAS